MNIATTHAPARTHRHGIVNARSAPSRKYTALWLLAFLLMAWTFQAASGAVQEEKLKQIFEWIDDSEYDISWVEDAGAYKSPNRYHNLRATYRTDSLDLQPRAIPEGEPVPWKLTLHLEGFSKGSRDLKVAGTPRWRVERKTARMSAEGIEIDYTNGKDGIRQNFLVTEPPPGSEPLTLRFQAVSEELYLEVANDEAVFTDAAGKEILTYRDLNVFDATGQRIEAAMVQTSPASFAIVVEDTQAVYPVLVDPLVNSQYGYGVAEAQSGARFGQAVLLAPLQGNNTTSIVIGAPYFDSGGNQDAGKVFAYIGVNGLPASATWTKTGDQAYGRIGWSLCSIDFDDDADEELAIGAPYYDSGGYSDNGKIWLHEKSGSSLNSTALWSTTGGAGSTTLGFSLASLDANNDTVEDLLAGAPSYSYSLTGNGGAFIYHGGGGLDTTADWSAYGGQS